MFNVMKINSINIIHEKSFPETSETCENELVVTFEDNPIQKSLFSPLQCGRTIDL